MGGKDKLLSKTRCGISIAQTNKIKPISLDAMTEGAVPCSSCNARAWATTGLNVIYA